MWINWCQGLWTNSFNPNYLPTLLNMVHPTHINANMEVEVAYKLVNRCNMLLRKMLYTHKWTMRCNKDLVWNLLQFMGWQTFNAKSLLKQLERCNQHGEPPGNPFITYQVLNHDVILCHPTNLAQDIQIARASKLQRPHNKFTNVSLKFGIFKILTLFSMPWVSLYHMQYCSEPVQGSKFLHNLFPNQSIYPHKSSIFSSRWYNTLRT